MKLMFPHEIDRYRIIQWIFRYERDRFGRGDDPDCRGISQTELAERASVSQATVSNVQNLERAAESAKRRVSREELLKLLTWGLELEQSKIDPVLWLFDNEPATEDEVRRYLRGYIAEARHENYTFRDLRKLVLDELKRVPDHLRNRSTQSIENTKLIPVGDLETNRTAVEDLYSMERRPGQRMLMMRYPSFVTLDEIVANRGDESVSDNDLSGEIRQRFASLNELRRENIDTYGERGIHQMEGVETYLFSDSLQFPKPERRRQVEKWMELLDSNAYPDYRVRFTDSPLALELSMKCVPPVFLGALVNEEPPWHETQRKAQWAMISDESFLIQCIVEFEMYWDRLEDEFPTNREASEYLRSLLDKYPN